jgi:16S rRNA (guanine(966)-N(2))-methyltransferase RsmD
MTLRPTSDKVREALFSILGTRVPGARFLDLYAGTGAVGIEALSRGATMVTFVEADKRAGQLLRRNLVSCQLLDQADIRIQRADVFTRRSEANRLPFDIVFADPPYAAIEEVTVFQQVWRGGLVSAEGVMVIEQHSRVDMPAALERAVLVRRYDYGDTALFLYGLNKTKATST